MSSGPNVCLESDQFSLDVPQAGYRPGRNLAHAVASELRARGETPGEPVPADWVWLVPIQREPYRLFIGCGLRDGSNTDWLAFAAAEQGPLSGLFQRANSTQRLSELTDTLRAVGTSGSIIKRCWLETDGA
jgi:hypothetical protein